MAHGDEPRMTLGEAIDVRDKIAERVTSSTDAVPREKARTISERLIDAGYVDIDFVLARVREDGDDEPVF